MSIKSIIISGIPIKYTHNFIAQLFWGRGIAQIKSISSLSYVDGEHVYRRSYITIERYRTYEEAYCFIDSLDDKTTPTYIQISLTERWQVHINPNKLDPDCLYFTTTFPDSFFQSIQAGYREEKYKAKCDAKDKDKDKDEDKVIDDYITGVKYTVDEAIERCQQILKLLDSHTIPGDNIDEQKDLCEELNFLEKKLRDYGNTRISRGEKLIKDFHKPGLYMTMKEANDRIGFLKGFIGSFSNAGFSLTLSASQPMIDEIDFLEDQIISMVTLKSQNVTLRPHQAAVVN